MRMIIRRYYFPGSSRDSECDTEHRLAFEGFSSYRPVNLASPDETPHRCSLQHENSGLKYYSLSRRLRKKKQEKVDTPTTYVHLTCPGGSTARLNSNKLMNPKKHGKRSARTRVKNSTRWDGVRVTDIAAAYSLLQTTLPPQRGQANSAKFHPTVFPGLNLRTGAKDFDLSSAKSALASLYGKSKRDLSIEFAVKLLMGEIRLPKEAAEVEELFNRKMNRENSSTGR
ncbi:unnamed protein product [Alopecurus aequalis]